MIVMVTVQRLLFSAMVVAGVAPFMLNCASSGDDTSSGSSAVSETEMVDCNALAGIPGLLPKDDSLTELESIGRCAWVLGTGRTSENPKFARKDASGKVVPGGLGGTENLADNVAKKGTYLPMLDLVKAKSEADRVQRWKDLGGMNDPGCKAATQPDKYGLWLDDCKDPHSAGVIGFRRFDNPKFDPAKWDVNKYSTDGSMEPPYLVGITCGACHTSFNPSKPPVDPAHPTWNNLVYTIGNQYFSEGHFYHASANGPTDFKAQVLSTQQRGTSDTSRVSTDHINNPNTINTIVNLASRPWHDEKLKAGQITFDLKDVDLVALNKMTFDQAAAALKPIHVQKDGEVHAVQSILKGGEDSVGPVGALLRVFVNIGMCSDQWLTHFDPVNGTAVKNSPLTAEELYANCPSYDEMLTRVPAMYLFLAKSAPIYLKDAPGGAGYINTALTDHGADVFADNCAGCHSSKQAPAGQDAKAWLRTAVHQPDFLTGNFLSDDKPYPITQIGTNAARALHSNHMEGEIWSGPYASDTYRSRKWPGPVSMANPYGDAIQFKGPDGGPGYYRTPTLVNIWARAPFLHNKSIGLYNGDPSVKGRMAAFDDAAAKLLTPSLRPGTIKRTDRDTVLELGVLGLKLHVPAGTPVNLLANIDPNDLQTKIRLAGISVSDFFGNATDDILGMKFDPNASSLFHGTVGNGIMEVSLSPDLIEDHGHTFGSDLSADDKKALIEFLKTL